MELPKVLGRAAVPVRLIPHLAPCLSAEELALILARQDARCKWDRNYWVKPDGTVDDEPWDLSGHWLEPDGTVDGEPWELGAHCLKPDGTVDDKPWDLSAHWLKPDGTVGDMHPDEWHAVALEIGLLGTQPDVLLRAIMALPAGVFVWQDELRFAYPKFIGEDGAYGRPVTNGNEDYEGSGALSFDRRPPPHPELIYAGFEQALADEVEAPVAAEQSLVPILPGAKRWTPELLTELSAHRAAHGTKAAAEKFGVTAARVRELLPSCRPQPKGYSAFNPRPK